MGGELERTVHAYVAQLGAQAQTFAAKPNDTLRPKLPQPPKRRMSGMMKGLASNADPLTIEGVLGEGGMAVVHLATQRSLSRKVAVKMLRPDEAGVAATTKLMREAYITGSLEHPNVMPVYDAHIGTDGQPRVVLKRIEGVPWSDLIAHPELAQERFGSDRDELLVEHLQVLMQVCRAAHFAHARRVIHRDIKPENVMIGEFGEVYLLDWGIAVELDGAHPNPSEELAGTPAYMAPEMLGTEFGTLSARTDVYLLGGSLFEILTGKSPHDGPTPAAMVFSVLQSQPEFPEGAPAELAAIARRALSAKAEDRFESAEAFRQAIASYIEHRASYHLAQEASRSLRELEATASGLLDHAEKRAQLLRLFGACRFGFAEALRMWPDNAEAKHGLTRAFVLVIEYEARHGDADAAAARINELREHAQPPAELVAEVETARRRAAAEQARLEKLETLSRMFDPRTEQRARWIVSTALALLGTALPASTQWMVDPHSNDYTMTFIHPAAVLVLVLGIAWWKRKAILATAYNRWVLSAVVAALCGQLLINVGGALMHVPVVSATAFLALLWGALAGMLAGAADRRVAAVSFGYLAAFFAIALIPANRRHANYIMSAAHLVTSITLFVIWQPKRGRDSLPAAPAPR